MNTAWQGGGARGALNRWLQLWAAPLAATTVSPLYTIKFPANGVLIGASAGTLEATPASLASVGMRMSPQGDQELVIGATGTGGDYLPLAAVVGKDGGPIMGLGIPFTNQTVWQVYFINKGALTYTPWVSLHCAIG